jgi:hypothetical protein
MNGVLWNPPGTGPTLQERLEVWIAAYGNIAPGGPVAHDDIARLMRDALGTLRARDEQIAWYETVRRTLAAKLEDAHREIGELRAELVMKTRLK